ncbi:MAG: glutaredoxin family protein [Candidatus Sericytochromatia bacterium]|nr:glutaredoxin family protein [Candidatus Sericytochromatia bacterium]
MNCFSVFEKLWQRLKPQVESSRFAGFDLTKQPDELVLYKFDRCIFCQRVMGFIRQHQLPVSYRDVQETPAYRQELFQLTGRTQVPCLVIDGQPMLESADIVAYLRHIYVSADKPTHAS